MESCDSLLKWDEGPYLRSTYCLICDRVFTPPLPWSGTPYIACSLCLSIIAELKKTW